MTRKEWKRREQLDAALVGLGFTMGETEHLRRISGTLRRWFELECGIGHGCIERDEATGKALWRNAMTGRAYPVADRETGARKRLTAIMAARNARTTGAEWHLTAYVQTDPRGAALYILRPGDVPEGKEPESYYSRGLCVY